MTRPQPAAFMWTEGGADGVERRGQVERDDRVPFFCWEIFDRTDMLDAGVVRPGCRG